MASPKSRNTHSRKQYSAGTRISATEYGISVVASASGANATTTNATKPQERTNPRKFEDKFVVEGNGDGDKNDAEASYYEKRAQTGLRLARVGIGLRHGIHVKLRMTGFAKFASCGW